MLMRELKRAKLVNKYSQRRNELKILIKSSDDFQVIMDSQAKLAKLPVNSNPVRHKKDVNHVVVHMGYIANSVFAEFV